MRRLKTGKVNNKVLLMIAHNYNRLKVLCGYRSYGCFCSKSYEDIFQDTILYVAQDEKATITTEEELIEHFCYRFKMIEFQTINDNKQLKETAYADYKKNKDADSENE